MKLTPPQRLCPGVQPLDRLTFRVTSLTNQKKSYLVDMERAHGLGQCDCPDATCRKNHDCKHIRLVRKFIAIQVAQEVIRQNEQSKPREKKDFTPPVYDDVPF